MHDCLLPKLVGAEPDAQWQQVQACRTIAEREPRPGRHPNAETARCL